MSEDSYELDGTVRIEENIRYYRYVPQKIYEITLMLDALSDEEQIKVMKYIQKITNKRITFRSLARKPSPEDQLKTLMRVDAKNNSL